MASLSPTNKKYTGRSLECFERLETFADGFRTLACTTHFHLCYPGTPPIPIHSIRRTEKIFCPSSIVRLTAFQPYLRQYGASVNRSLPKPPTSRDHTRCIE